VLLFGNLFALPSVSALEPETIVSQFMPANEPALAAALALGMLAVVLAVGQLLPQRVGVAETPTVSVAAVAFTALPALTPQAKAVPWR
jgi:hypothetical protein